MVKKHSREIILTTYILTCTVSIFGCGKAQTEITTDGFDDLRKILVPGETDTAPEQDKSQDNPDTVTIQDEEQETDTETYFYEKADEQGVTQKEAQEYWERLLADDIFQGETMELTGLVIEDMDKNGQDDLLVMVLDREEKPFYGSGCVWIYMNEDGPYCFADEDVSYYGWFDSFAEDIDNDGNVEIVLSTQGSGCGAVGDSYKAVLKYQNHGFERMELPSDLPEEYDRGIDIMVYQEPEENYYSAYCDYLKENIYFHAESTFEPEKEAVWVGGNARGFYNLRPVKYEGKNALQASEYLYGEGGIVHNVATAQFIILWDKNGDAYIDKWWIDEDKNCYTNSYGNRITYADGYYYYASQLDNYFLYRVKEDGSDAKCLAKAHSGSILADGDVLYFVNLSDDKAIYRIGTDGSDMRKVCDNSDNNIQMSAEYIYFCDTYEREADIRGLFSEEEAEEIEAEDEYLRDPVFYRIRKDGSGKEILYKTALDCTLAAANGEKAMYDGYLYCRRMQRNEETEQEETLIQRYDLNVENKEEICRFDFDVDSLIVCGDRIYCFGAWESAGKIGEYNTWKKEVKYLPDKELTDFCVYNGTLYGIVEDVDEDSRLTRVYKLEEGETQWEEIYHNDAERAFYDGVYWETSLTDIYATEQGVFFRQFVSPEEGVKWFSLSDTDNAGKWENENVIPITKQASMMEYNRELSSIKSTVASKSTSGYEAYLKEDLTYEEFYRKDGADIYTCGKDYNPYTIRLPQFNEKIEGYREINAYFQNAYKEALGYKEEFFDMLDKESETEEYGFPNNMMFEGTDYDYVYIGEKYITVAKYQVGYWGGMRDWYIQEPVTFERKTGRVVTLEDFFGDEAGEAVARATAAVYKYMENGQSDGRRYFLKDEDTLTEEFIPDQFFLFPEGIGLYYRRYAIDCGAAGDYVFIVPYPERNEATQQETEEYESGYANPQGNRITYEDGYFYYASQLDNYFLHRVKEDGSEAECLAKVHSGTILADGDVLYFVNLSDNKAIYRIGTDGSDMKKICDNSDNDIQMSAEYIYFWDTYKHEADIRGLFSEAQELSWRSFLYRIRKDGSGKELLMGNIVDYRIAAANGGKVMYDGYLYCSSNRKNEETGQRETVVTRYDLNAENEEEICCFNFEGDILVFGSDLIYCHDFYGSGVGRLGIYITWKKEIIYPPNEKVTDYCYYKGTLYGIREDKAENRRLTRVYKLEEGETQWEEIYCNDAACTSSSGYYYRENLTDIYATEQGVFFRQFVSSEEGVKWFLLSEDGNAVKWEDESVIPITKQASMMKYTSDYISIKRKFQSTDGYEEYLGEDLTYEEFYRTDEEGKSYNPYRICLPQFNEKIEGCWEINAYFQNAYKEALKDKEEFFDMLDEESEKDENGFPNSYLCERTDYDYVYIGEEYITVAMYRHGYSGGKRSWTEEAPVTFERKTGRVVTLEEFFGDAPGEAVARATASIYKYMENGDGYGAKYFLKDYDALTAAFEPEQFFLFPEGIGIYYRRYAIDSGADGDYVFIVPYPD